MKVVPGALIDYYADGEIVAGVVLSEEKGRLRVVTDSGREDRIAPARILAAYEGNPRLASGTSKQSDAARLEAARDLASRHARTAQDKKASIDVPLVWDLIVDEGGEKRLDELSDLALGDRGAGAVAAILRALLDEKVHFARRGDLWEPRPRSAVEETRRQREREARRAEERRQFLDAVRRTISTGVPFARAGTEEEERILRLLEELAVQGSAGPATRETLAALSELPVSGETPEETAFRTLRALGVFSEDENLLIRRFGLRVEFPEGAEEIALRAVRETLGLVSAGDHRRETESENSASGSAPDLPPTASGSSTRGERAAGSDTGAKRSQAVSTAWGAGGRDAGHLGADTTALPPGLADQVARGIRRDFTALEAFSIDDELTSEIDDALSVEPVRDGCWRVGIHIADPGFFILPGSELDRIAEMRAVTFYLPDRRVLMLPPALSEDAAALLADHVRPTLSFLATIDAQAGLEDWEIVPSVIRSRARVTYEEADAAVGGSRTGAEDPGPSTRGRPPAFAADQCVVIHRLAVALEQARVDAGAHIIRAPEVDLSVSAEGAITLKRLEGDSPGRLLVSEMMVLAGRIAAQFCLKRAIPCIYRRQPPPEEQFPSVRGGPYDAVAVRKARRGLRRGETGLAPGRHFALGLDAYAQATSPIRRYQDLAIHRQIKTFLLTGKPCYDVEALQRIAATTDEAERVARLAERGSDEYWTLRYLERQLGGVIEGVVVQREARRVEVELAETLYTVSIPPRPDHELGARLRLLVEKVNPRGPSLRLRQLD